MSTAIHTMQGRLLHIESCQLSVNCGMLPQFYRLTLRLTISSDSDCSVQEKLALVLLAPRTYDDFCSFLEPGQDLAIVAAEVPPHGGLSPGTNWLVGTSIRPLVRRPNLDVAELDTLEKRLATDQRSQDAAQALMARLTAPSRH